MLESYALPGQLNIGSDSHTPHVGAIGCVALGFGTTDVFNSWITKDVRVKVPESVKVVVRGKRRQNVTAKDFILKILSLDYVRSGKALAKVMEYAGEAIEELSVDERATMTNMAAEIGGLHRVSSRPTRKQFDFLVERRSLDRVKAETMMEGLYSDPGAQYAHVIELSAADHADGRDSWRPGQRKIYPRTAHARAGSIAYGGTCTAGKNEDMDMYALVLADALKHGKRIAESVRFYIQFGSQETRDLLTARISGCVSESRSARDRTQLRSLRRHQGREFRRVPIRLSSAHRIATSPAAVVPARCIWPLH